MRWLLALWLAIAPACAQEAVIGSGVYGGTKAQGYKGPGDIVSGAVVWYGLRAYTAAIAAAATQKLVNVRNSSSNETCDILVATNGGFAATVSNCSGASSGTAVATFCSGGGGSCSVAKFYDQSGNGFDAPQLTAATQPGLLLSCLGSLPCLTFNGSTHFNGVSITSTSEPSTLVVLAERTGSFTTTMSTFSAFNGGNQPLIGYSNSGNTMRLYAGTVVTATASDSAMHALQGTLNGASSVINVDGSETAVNPGAGQAATSIALGCDTLNCTGPLTGQVSEAGLWPLAFNATQRSNMHSNMSSYWGTP